LNSQSPSVLARQTDAPPTLWLAGYGAWPVATRAERLIGSLRAHHVTCLVDVRLNPCASDVKPGRYGPKPWTLQSSGAGIDGLLASAGIAYEWIVELGNPQRHDRAMAVLREHLADPERRWPVHRGLDRLAELATRPGEVIALLCACADYRSCHRTLIARALLARLAKEPWQVRDLRHGESVTSAACSM
jgi:hypothetical protein